MDHTLPFLTGETTIQHALTDTQGKGGTSLQGIVYKIKLSKKRCDTKSDKTFRPFMNSNLVVFMPK